MTSLVQQIEEMRVRLNELAGSEQGLVKALGDALNRADQKMLQDVRTVTVEHELRRGVILKELQVLALRIGAFPNTHDAEIIEHVRPELPSYVAAGSGQPTYARGDWRQAASNIRDELEEHLNGGQTGAH